MSLSSLIFHFWGKSICSRDSISKDTLVLHTYHILLYSYNKETFDGHIQHWQSIFELKIVFNCWYQLRRLMKSASHWYMYKNVESSLQIISLLAFPKIKISEPITSQKSSGLVTDWKSKDENSQYEKMGLQFNPFLIKKSTN